MYKIYSFFISKIRMNKMICYILFGIYYKNRNYGGYWDWVTLGLRNFLRQNKDSLTKLLDLGTGPYGVLAFYAHKLNCGCKIIGADYCAELIENVNSIDSPKDIKFIHSDLFSNITDKFDFIIFNAPYIDLNFGKSIGVLNNKLSEKRWSGGNGGIETIINFLSSVESYLTTNGLCALGVNGFYVKDKVVRDLIVESNFQLFSVSKNLFTKANIYVLKHQ